jgi:hypothetical protein
MTKPIVPLKSGDEEDAFSRKARKLLSFKSGTRKEIKRKFWRRARKILRLKNNDEEDL